MKYKNIQEKKKKIAINLVIFCKDPFLLNLIVQKLIMSENLVKSAKNYVCQIELKKKTNL